MIDKIDKKIIELLMDDSRITNVQIAQKIKRSESTVRQRMTKLVERGIIKRFSIMINPIAFGYNTEAFVGINTNPSKLLKVIKSLKKIKSKQGKQTKTKKGAAVLGSKALEEYIEHLTTVLIVRLVPRIVPIVSMAVSAHSNHEIIEHSGNAAFMVYRKRFIERKKEI